jgi:C4-dicarboxylate-specific signal transduction histidine kinase
MENRKVLFIIPENKHDDSLRELAAKINAPIDIEYDEITGYNMLKKGGYDLVISCMFSGKLNGYELVSRIKRDKIKCGIILLMKDSKDKIKKELLEKGALLFIKKAENEDEINKQIEDYFKKKNVLHITKQSSLEHKGFELKRKIFKLEQKLLEKSEELDCIKKKSEEIDKEFKETKKRLSNKRKYLINYERMISVGQMTASIVHEINNPVTVITTLASAIAMESKDNPKITRYNKTLAENIDKLRNFTCSILSFANPNMVDKMDSISVDEEINEVLTIYGYEIKRSEITLKKKFDPTLPYIKIPRIKLQQVVLNILKNALFAVEKEHGIITIKTSIKDDFVTIDIKDNGKGIPKNELDDIFKPFFTTKSKKDGSGLGLFICKDIIEKYNGTINVKSVLDKGTTITIKLPVAEK